jgi:hypothetical protein
MAVRVAATLRIADHVAAGRTTTAELAEAVGAHVDALDRLLRYLAARRVLSRDSDGRYALTSLGDALRDDHPAGLRAGLDIDGIGRADLAFVQLLHSVRTGQAGFPRQFGRAFWDDLAADPARTAAFNTYMGSDVPARSRAILGGYDWGSLDHVVDVGGGNGSLMVSMLTAYPSLRGTVLDLPETADAARKALTAAGLAHRGDVVGSSFFDPLPAGAGGYVLSLIVHDWDDDAARAILRRCAEAAGTTGSVFVVENIGADGESPHTGMDLRMLVLYGGKERGVAELAALAGDCGLRLVAVHPAGGLAIVEFAAA